jgi:hypothetical protein
MKTVIQHSETLQYWKENDTWVADHHQAWNFADCTDAMLKFMESTLPYQIVQKYDGKRYDVVVIKFNGADGDPNSKTHSLPPIIGVRDLQAKDAWSSNELAR